jgi:autotransporter-associated beta strand protein
LAADGAATADGTAASPPSGKRDACPTFQAAASPAFTGELRLERATFALDSAAAAPLAAATLRIGPDALVEKAPGDLALHGLAFSGGTLALPLAAAGSPDGLLSTAALDTGAGGVIAIDASLVPDDLASPPVPPAISLFDIGALTDVRLVAAGTVAGAGAFSLVDRATGATLPSPTTHNIVQAGGTVATAAYGHTVAVQASGDAPGLYLAHGLTAINILPGETLLLDNTGAARSTLGAVISGSGGVDLRAAAGSPLTLAAANTYTGPTRLLSGVVMVSNTGAFSRSPSVTIDAGATLDISLTGNNARQTLVRELSGSGSIMLGNASLVIEVAGDTEFSGNLTGNPLTYGRLFKTGSGTLTLSGDNRFGDRTYVNAGRLRVTSPTGLGNGAYAILAASAVLEFNGLPENNQGKIWFQGNGRIEVIDSRLTLESPQNAIGALAISGSSFVTAIGPAGPGINTGSGTGAPGAYDGSLGGKNVAVTVGAGSTLAIAPRSVVSWGIALANTGTLLAGSLALDGGSLRLDPGATLAVTGSVSIAPGGKIAFAGGGLSHLTAAAFTAAAADPFATGALSLYDVPEGMTLAVSARPGGGYDYLVVNHSASPLRGLNLALNAAAAALDAVDGHLDDHLLLPLEQPLPDPRRTWTNTAWLKGIAGGADYENTAALPGHTERLRGLVAGIDARTRRHLLAGLYAGTTDSDLATAGAANTLTVDTAQHFAGAYAALRFGLFHLNAGLAAGKSDADVFRDEPAGLVRGAWSASHLAGTLGAGLVLHAWEGAILKPSVTLRHVRVKLRDYEERGPGAMLVPDLSEKLLQSIVRVQADQAFTLFGRPAAAGLSLGWKQALRAPRDRLDAAFADEPDMAVTLRGVKEPRASALLGINLRAALARATALSLDAAHELSADRTRDTATLTLAHSW